MRSAAKTHPSKSVAATGEAAHADDFLVIFDEKLRVRNDRLRNRLLAWGELLDAAGWCVALKMPDDAGFWLSGRAAQDVRSSGEIPRKWNELLEAMERIPETKFARRAEGVLIWSGCPAAMLRPEAGLTRREAEVLSWLREGKTSSEIAIILGCAARTVDKHLANLYRKIGVRNRAEVILKTAESLS